MQEAFWDGEIVRHYEYGDTFPGKKEMMSLAKLYGMSPGELFDELIGWRGCQAL